MTAQQPPILCTNPLVLHVGAVVLAHSLRDNGSQAKLVALYTPDTLQAATISELQVRIPRLYTHDAGFVSAAISIPN